MRMKILAALVAGGALALASSQPTIESLDALAGDAAASPSDAEAVNGSAPLIPPVTLVLRGEVRDLPAGAHLDAVTLEVGGRPVTASVSGHAYVAHLVDARVDEMVVIQAAAGAIRYRAVAGSVAGLARSSPADSDVTALESPSLVIDSLATAFAVVQRAFLGGRDPRDEAEYEKTLVHLSGMSFVGYLLDAYAKGELPLPAGFATGLDAVQSQQVVREAMDALPSGDPIGSYLRAREARAPLSPGMLPGKSLLRAAVAPDQHDGGTTGYFLMKEPDGRFSFVDWTPVPDTSVTVNEVAGGALMLRPTYVRTQVSYPSRPDLGGANSQVKQVDMLEAIEVRRVMDRETVDTWVVSWHWIQTFPDFPMVPPTRVVATGLHPIEDLDRTGVRGAWSSLGNTRRTFPVICSPSQPGMRTVDVCDTAVHRFDPGGSGITEDVGYKIDERMLPRMGSYGSAFEWARETDGELVLRSGDSRLRVWSTGTWSGIDAVVFIASHKRDGATWTFSGRARTVEAATVPFGPAQATGSWGLGFALSIPFSYPPDDETVTILERYADGTGAQVSRGPEGEFRSLRGWSVVGERLYEVRYSARFPGGSRQVTSCAEAAAQGATHCSPAQVRYLRPLRRVGNRLYGIEEIHTRQGQDQPIGYTGSYEFTTSTRANYQECLSGECLRYASGLNATSTWDTPPEVEGGVQRRGREGSASAACVAAASVRVPGRLSCRQSR